MKLHIIFNSTNFIPPCYINKNYDEYTKSILKINPYVYLSGSLIKNNDIIFINEKTTFGSFMGILNIKQITDNDFILPQSDIDFINNWKNENDKTEFTLKYTDTTIFPINNLKGHILLSDIVHQIKLVFPNNKIILHVGVCRQCTINENFNDLCINNINQIPILKNPKRRDSFSLSSININNFENIDDLLLSNHNNFQKIFDFVKNNSNNDNIQNIIVEYNHIYNLSNNNICDILSEYLKIKNI